MDGNEEVSQNTCIRVNHHSKICTSVNLELPVVKQPPTISLKLKIMKHLSNFICLFYFAAVNPAHKALFLYVKIGLGLHNYLFCQRGWQQLEPKRSTLLCIPTLYACNNS